jgi:prepilin-type N-terminal cleavage/methylation domain-containing protein
MQAGTGRQMQMARAGAPGGFTLIELLVVIGIIGALTVIGIPAMRGLGQSNTVTSGTQQLVDDLMLARHKAMVNRTVVHVVFVPDSIRTPATPPAQLTSTKHKALWDRLRGGAYTTYAVYAERTLGDQPGQWHGRYITDWRTLPEGVFIAKYEYNLPDNNFNTRAALDRPFGTNRMAIPFPTEDSPVTLTMPTISFDENGRFFQYETGTTKRRYREEYLHMAKGSVLVARLPNGDVELDARESPPFNSSSNFNRIRIDAMSGRAKLERPEIKMGE